MMIWSYFYQSWCITVILENIILIIARFFQRIVSAVAKRRFWASYAQSSWLLRCVILIYFYLPVFILQQLKLQCFALELKYLSYFFSEQSYDNKQNICCIISPK